jgi:hypothetical protein
MRIPIDSFMNKKSLFRIDSTNNKINEELMVAVRNAPETEIETGSWITMELTSALGTLLDTTKDIRWLEYKRVLLTPGNMILIRSSSVTEINFYFHTQEPLTEELVKRLLSKPVSLQQSFFKSQFFYIDNNTFELTVNGFFQIVGQFMKSELQ